MKQSRTQHSVKAEEMLPTYSLDTSLNQNVYLISYIAHEVIAIQQAALSTSYATYCLRVTNICP